jgi:hypothetical protein
MSEPDRGDTRDGDGSTDADFPDPARRDDPPDRGENEREGDENDDDDWRFGLSEVDEDGVVTPPITPEKIDPENALFVLLGAIAMVLVFVRLWLLVS